MSQRVHKETNNTALTLFNVSTFCPHLTPSHYLTFWENKDTFEMKFCSFYTFEESAYSAARGSI